MAQSRILQSPYESVNAEHKSAYATVEKAFEKYPDNLALVSMGMQSQKKTLSWSIWAFGKVCVAGFTDGLFMCKIKLEP